MTTEFAPLNASAMPQTGPIRAGHEGARAHVRRLRNKGSDAPDRRRALKVLPSSGPRRAKCPCSLQRSTGYRAT